MLETCAWLSITISLDYKWTEDSGRGVFSLSVFLYTRPNQIQYGCVTGKPEILHISANSWQTLELLLPAAARVPNIHLPPPPPTPQGRQVYSTSPYRHVPHGGSIVRKCYKRRN